MANARIAAALLVLPAILAAQPVPASHITVKVTDITGAFIAGARIEIDPQPSKTTMAATTDRNGDAFLDVLPGSHVVRVSARIFVTLSETIELQKGIDETVTAVLEVATGDPVIIDASIEPDLRIPLDPPTMLIPLQTQQVLTTLPAVATPCPVLTHNFWPKSVHCKGI